MGGVITGSACFDPVAGQYAATSLVQNNAAAELVRLLDIGVGDAVLDLGCGPGHITARLAGFTSGPVTGTDASPEMIARARDSYPYLTFRTESAEELAETAAHDRIFCNSAFQWFASDPARVIRNCYRALKPGGRMAVQAPGSDRYCPLFQKGMALLAEDPVAGPAVRSFVSPWLFLDTAGEYAALFREGGFDVPYAEIVTTRSSHSVARAVGVFRSGAAAAYLNGACYREPLPDGWEEILTGTMERLFRASGDGDTVTLEFNRIYLTADKPQ